MDLRKMNSRNESIVDDPYKVNQVGKTGRINNDIEDSEDHSELLSQLEDPIVLVFDDHS